MKPILAALILGAGLGLTSPVMAADDAIAEAVQDYMDFATYEAGIILPDQITEELLPSVTFVDVRDAGQFEAETIDGAINIEWREIPARLDELPEDGLVVFFCNTGTLSSQATFAARLLGRENVVVLQTGINGWKAR